MFVTPSKPYYNIDSASRIISGALYDGYRDDADAFCSRFGLTEYADVGTSMPGDGLFWWDKEQSVLAFSNGRCWKMTHGGALTELTGGNFLSAATVIVAEGQKTDNTTALYACNGGKLNYSTGGNFTQQAAPAPQTCTHVVYNGLRFIANETDTARMYFTDISPVSGEFDPEYWAATENPLTTDSRGDDIAGLYQAWDDIAAWGSLGRELWQTTGGEPPLEPRLGSLSEAGLIAPYSVRKADNTYYALCKVDHKAAVVAMQANEPVIISLDIEKLLDNLTVLTDAIGDIISVGGQSFYLITFPTENQSFCYNIKKKEWYLWSLWDLNAAVRNAFLARHFVYAPDWGLHLCQSRINGKIYKVDVAATDDDGSLIRSEWQTGWFDGETTANKILLQARFHLKRGLGGGSGNEPVFVLRYRDNGRQVWKNERQISLGKQGEYELYKTLNNLGTFRSRQFSLITTDAAKIAIAGIDLHLRLLRN